MVAPGGTGRSLHHGHNRDMGRVLAMGEIRGLGRQRLVVGKPYRTVEVVPQVPVVCPSRGPSFFGVDNDAQKRG